MQQLRVGQIGVGGMGRVHLSAVEKNARARLVAVCDVVPETAQKVGEQFQVPGYTDYRDLLQRDDLDALIVVLPHNLYPEVIEAAAAKGLHILKEKPFSRNLADAQRMVQAVENSGVKFMCAAQRQFSSTFQQAKAWIDAGLLGDIYMLEGTILYSWNLDPNQWRWRGRREQSGGIAIVDSGWHILEASYWMHGLPNRVFAATGTKQAVSGSYDIDDKAALVLEYPDGSIGSITTCFLALPNRFELLLHGTRGNIAVDLEQAQLYDRVKLIEEYKLEGEADAVAAQFDHFVDVVQEGVKPVSGIREAYQVASIIDAAYRSAAGGKPEAVTALE